MARNGDEEKKERSERHFCKVCNRGFGCGGHINNVKEEHSGNKLSEGNCKHPYDLQDKTRFADYQVSEEETDENKSRTLIKMDKNSDDHDRYSASSEEKDLANCLVMLSNKSCALSSKKEITKAKRVEIKGNFQCKSCKKIFNSHQALGGHRASHKKVKGCFAAKLDNSDNNNNNNNNEQVSIADMEDDEVLTTLEYRDSYLKKRSKEHECSVCRRVFSSGQALGGHKRCHWLTSASLDNAFMPNFHEFQYDHSQQLYKKPTLAPASIPTQLDLNLQSCLVESITGDNTVSKCKDSTRLHLKQWGKEEVLNNLSNENRHKIQGTIPVSFPDGRSGENTSEIKLSGLREMNLDGGSSSWLQVGIASTTDI